MKTNIILIGIFLLVLFSGCSRNIKVNKKQVSPLNQLRSDINYLVSDPTLANADIGIYIESLKSGDIIYRKNEHKLFIPASNMKLFTTFAALKSLKPDYKIETQFYTNGQISDSILQGDLYIKGFGDPSISGRFYDDDFYAVFQQWRDSLKSLGIARISGSIIGDDSYFQTRGLGYGWQWDDEPFWYSAQMSALSFNDNCVDISITPAENPGEKPKIQLMPDSKYLTVRNDAVTISPDSQNSLFVTRERFENTLLFSGGIPSGKNASKTYISVLNPSLYFCTALTEYFNKNGIKVDANPLVISEPGKLDYSNKQKLFTNYSPEMKELIKVVNKNSQNFYAEQLLLSMAAKFTKKSNSRSGAKYVTNLMGSLGIPEAEFVMYDGSGLSRVNMISPNAVATLLRSAYRSDYFEEYWDSLPIAGVDGTLKRRMQGMSAVSKVRAKTGYVQHVRSLSGYAETLDGEYFLFSILVNDYTVPTSAINLLQDRICERLANFTSQKF